MRTVHLFEHAGAAAVQLEDQVLPKRCGHFDGKRVVDTGEMVARIRAALRARQDPALLIVARTDALAVEGMDAAIRRAQAYREAGADVLFVEAPESEQELERIPAELTGVPLVVNVVEGGRTPELSTTRLAELGYQIVLYANLVSRVMAKSAQQALLRLRQDGDTRGSTDAMLSWSERQSLVMLPLVEAIEDDLFNGAAATATGLNARHVTERGGQWP
jgi:2-methylisocitrate lyase-like PEP mutase family enzyme